MKTCSCIRAEPRPATSTGPRTVSTVVTEPPLPFAAYVLRHRMVRCQTSLAGPSLAGWSIGPWVSGSGFLETDHFGARFNGRGSHFSSGHAFEEAAACRGGAGYSLPGPAIPVHDQGP